MILTEILRTIFIQILIVIREDDEKFSAWSRSSSKQYLMFGHLVRIKFQDSKMLSKYLDFVRKRENVVEPECYNFIHHQWLARNNLEESRRRFNGIGNLRKNWNFPGKIVIKIRQITKDSVVVVRRLAVAWSPV